jgi:hypothetical protein
MGNCCTLLSPIALEALDGSEYERDAIDEPSIFFYNIASGEETLRVQRYNDRFELTVDSKSIKVSWHDDASITEEEWIKLLAGFIRASLPLRQMCVAITNFGTHSFMVAGISMAWDPVNTYLQPTLKFAKHIDKRVVASQKMVSHTL